jgi:hypothetical protein
MSIQHYEPLGKNEKSNTVQHNTSFIGPDRFNIHNTLEQTYTTV